MTAAAKTAGQGGARPPGLAANLTVAIVCLAAAAGYVALALALPAGHSQGDAGPAALPLQECEVFEVVLSATWRDVPVRVLRSDGTTSQLLLLSDDEERAASVGARLVEPGVYEATAPTDELVGVQGVTNELGTSREAG